MPVGFVAQGVDQKRLVALRKVREDDAATSALLSPSLLQTSDTDIVSRPKSTKSCKLQIATSRTWRAFRLEIDHLQFFDFSSASTLVPVAS
jgi:hypothetical protein